MRILHISEAFTGGLFASVTGLANGLADRGHDVHIAYSRRAETPDDVRTHVRPSITLHELSLARAIDPRADAAGLLAIRRLVRALNPDIVHLHSSKAGVLGRVAARLGGVAHRVFYSPRGLAFLQEDRSPAARRVYQAIEWTTARFGGTVVACSQSELDMIRSRIRPRRAVLVENGIDVAAISPWRDRGDGRVVIAGAGRLTYARNASLFAQIAAATAAPDADFVWIGDGDAADRAALEHAGVRVTGWLPREDVLRRMSSIDVHLHPSRWEGMPIALIESQVAGVPAVATDVVGNRDVVEHGVTGYLGASPAELATHVRGLIADPLLRRRLGTNARDHALARFNLTRVVDDFERLYASAVTGAPLRRRRWLRR